MNLHVEAKVGLIHREYNMQTHDMQQKIRTRIEKNVKIIKARQGLDKALHCVLADLTDLLAHEQDCGQLQNEERFIDDES